MKGERNKMIPQVQQIALRIRELREILEIEASAIAREIDVTNETYAAYESGECDIPVGKLYQIANSLNADPTLLLMGDSPRMVDYTIIRQGNGISVERFAGYRFTSLAYNYIGRQMEPMIVTLEPGDERPRLVTHEGQEFNYVLDGSIAVTLRDREYILHTGDCIYFNPSLEHGQRAIGKKAAKFLTVINETGIK